MNFTSLTDNQSIKKAPLNLDKGGILDLTKQDKEYRHVALGGGWNQAQNGPSGDLDLSAFLLDRNGRITNPAEQVVYFRQMSQKGISLDGDNRTGAGEGDDETISINLDEISQDIHRIVFFITIFDAKVKNQTFGQISEAYVRLIDKDDYDFEIVRFNLTENYGADTAVTAAELFRNSSGGWSFKAIGEGSIADLNDLAVKYM